MSKHGDNIRDHLVTSLVSVFPDDPAALAAKERLRSRDPEAVAEIRPYVEREGLGEVITEIHDISPIPVADLLKTDPNEKMDFFFSFKEKGWHVPNREGLVNAICSAAVQDLEWGFRLLAAMIATQHYDNDIWVTVLWKLKWENLSQAQRNWLIETFDRSRGYSADFLRPFTRLVLDRAFPDSQEGINPEYLNKVLKLSFNLWDAVKSEPAITEIATAERDWIFDAINSVAGQVCEYWLMFTQYRQKMAPELERTWPEEIAPYVDNILNGRTHSDQMGLAILGQHLAPVRYLAPVWTVTRFYDCFDFEVKGDLAFISWNAFAGYGRLSRELATELPPYFQKGFKRIPEMKESLAERFVGLVAAISVSGLWDVKGNSWLDTFHENLSPKLRRKWLSQLARLLKGSLASDKSQIWKEWLEQWWKLRTQGLPTAIVTEETEGFYQLAMALGSHAKEAVPLLKKCPTIEIAWSHIFLDVQHSTLFNEDPQGLVEIVLWLLPQVQNLSSSPKDIDAFIDKLPPASSLKKNLEEICENVMRLNVGTSTDLLLKIENKFIV